MKPKEKNGWKKLWNWEKIKYENTYKIPTETCIGHVHLKVSNLQKSLEFYCDLLGFEITTMYGEEAAFISAGGYHHHIGLNTWYSKNFSFGARQRCWIVSYRYCISNAKRFGDYL